MSAAQVLALVGAGFLAFLVVLVGGVLIGAPDPVGAAAQRPFIGVVQEGQSAATPNDVAVVEAKRRRGAELCDLLGDDLQVENWVGTVESAGTEIGGDKGVLRVAIAKDVAVVTGGSETMIDPSAQPYSVLGTLKPGDRIQFSGEFESDPEMCIKEYSLMSENGLRTPDFVMSFTALGLADE